MDDIKERAKAYRKKIREEQKQRQQQEKQRQKDHLRPMSKPEREAFLEDHPDWFEAQKMFRKRAQQRFKEKNQPKPEVEEVEPALPPVPQGLQVIAGDGAGRLEPAEVRKLWGHLKLASELDDK